MQDYQAEEITKQRNSFRKSLLEREEEKLIEAEVRILLSTAKVILTCFICFGRQWDL